MDALTPAQERTLEQLMARSTPRPVFARDLGDRLRATILEGIADVDVESELWLGKERLNDHARCEGLFTANLLREGPPFEHGRRSAAGKLAHRAIQTDVGRGRADPSRALVDRAARRLGEEDRSFGPYWDALDPVEASEVADDAVRFVEQFRATFPPLEHAWSPVAEFPVRVEIGPVRVLGFIDLVLGREDPEEPMRARRIAIDLKSGFARPEFPEDMRLYALLLTLRTGVPPFRVASLFLDSGDWQAEDVTEQTLFHAAERLVAAAQAAGRLLGGDEPALTPGHYCAWCPRKETCPAVEGLRAM